MTYDQWKLESPDDEWARLNRCSLDDAEEIEEWFDLGPVTEDDDEFFGIKEA